MFEKAYSEQDYRDWGHCLYLFSLDLEHSSGYSFNTNDNMLRVYA